MPKLIPMASGRTYLPALIARTRCGDSAALAEVYSRYAPSLMRLCWRLLQSREDAEDAVHDVFVGLPEALRSYDERGNFDSWLKRITARLAISRIRACKNSRQQSLDDYPLIESRDRADERAESAPIQQAVDSLSEQLRLVFVLKVMEGHSHAEISSLLGISRPASEVRLHRAIRALRIALKSHREVQ